MTSYKLVADPSAIFSSIVPDRDRELGTVANVALVAIASFLHRLAVGHFSAGGYFPTYLRETRVLWKASVQR